VENTDGSVLLSFPAPSIYEVKRWVLPWGGDAEVLEPASLREALAAEARSLQARYAAAERR
jgi:predicted DNA-binding transcriptional regulator YafY